MAKKLRQIALTVTLTLLVMCVVLSTADKVPTAKAAGMTLHPTQGPVGTVITVNLQGFTAGEVITVTFNGQTVIRDLSSGQTSLTTSFGVPGTVTTYGSYDIVATNRDSSATAKFTVTAPGSATDSPSDTSSPSSTDHSSSSATPKTSHKATLKPGATPKESGLSSGVIAAIVVVVAIAIILPLVFYMRGRGRPNERDLLRRDEVPSPIRRDQFGPPPNPPSNPYSRGTGTPSPYSPPASRYGRPTYQTQTRSYGTGYSSRTPVPPSRYGSSSSSSFGRQSSAGFGGRTCPSCHRTIREGYSTCPYCYKKLR